MAVLRFFDPPLGA